MNVIRKRLYKNPKWLTILLFASILTAFLIIDIIFGVFLENKQWYFKPMNPNNGLINNGLGPYTEAQARGISFESWLAFLSVQVHMISVIYLIIYLKNFDAPEDSFIKTSLQKAVMNWNMLDFVLFWFGVFGGLIFPNAMGEGTNGAGGKSLGDYTPMQLSATIVTHVVCPIFIFVLFYLDSGIKKIQHKNVLKDRELYLTYSYPFCYLIFVIIRGSIYMHSNWSHLEHVWTYGFINFDAKMGINIPGVVYFIVVVIVFLAWLLLHTIILNTISNQRFKTKNIEDITTLKRYKIKRSLEPSRLGRKLRLLTQKNQIVT